MWQALYQVVRDNFGHTDPDDNNLYYYRNSKIGFGPS